MRAQTLYSHSLGVSSGLGFVGTVILMGILAGLFVLWSFSCLGGGFISLAAMI